MSNNLHRNADNNKRLKVSVALTGRHVSYWISQCYLPPDTDERALPSPLPSRLVLDLPTLEGWKAELAWVVWLSTKTVYPRTVTRLSTNPARGKVGSLAQPTMLSLSHTATPKSIF